MAITSIDIVKNNVVSGSNLIAIHNPVSFIVAANYSGDTPLELNCRILDIDNNELADYRMIPYRDNTETQREFLFKASQALKSVVGSGFDDFFQLLDTLEYVDGLTKELILEFYDPENESIATTFTGVFVNAAKQFSQSVNMSDEFSNDSKTYYAPKGKWAYVYFYNDNNLNEVTATEI